MSKINKKKNFETKQDNVIIGSLYDNVFKTLLNDCPALIIPVINEIFNENHSIDEEIVFFNPVLYLFIRK